MASLMGKHKIAIDTTTLADGDSIASYLVDSAGALLTSTLVGGTQQSLDVNVTQSALPTGAATEATLASVLAELQALTNVDGSVWAAGSTGAMSLAVRHDATGPLTGVADGDFSPLQVDANGALKISGTINVTDNAEYAEDSAANSGDIGIFTLLVRQDTLAISTSTDGDYGAFKSTAKGELYTHDADSLAQLLLIKADTASIVTNTGTTATNTGTIASTLTALSKAEDAVAVSGDQGIQALAVRKDAQGSNAADGDYTSLQTWSEGSLKVVDVANASILQQQVAVSTTAAQVPAANLASRKSLMIQNTGSSKVWIGSATLTSTGAASGIELPANSFMELECGPAVNVFAKTNAGSGQLNILEMA